MFSLELLEQAVEFGQALAQAVLFVRLERVGFPGHLRGFWFAVGEGLADFAQGILGLSGALLLFRLILRLFQPAQARVQVHLILAA